MKLRSYEIAGNAYICTFALESFLSFSLKSSYLLVNKSTLENYWLYDI